MDKDVLIALISAGGAVLAAIVGLLGNLQRSASQPSTSTSPVQFESRASPARRWLVPTVIALATAVAVSIVAVAVRDGSRQRASCDRKLAFIGPTDVVGSAARNGEALAISEYNRANGCAIGLIEADQNGAGRLANDLGIVGVVNAFYSGPTKAIQPVFEQAGVAAIALAATDTSLSHNGWKTFFRAVGSSDAQLPAESRYLTDVLGASAVHLVGDTIDSQASLAGMRDRLGAAAAGLDIVAAKSTEDVAKRIVNDPVVSHVYFLGSDLSAGSLVRLLRNAGITAPLMMGTGAPCWMPADGGYAAGFVAAAGANNVAGTIYTSTCLPTARVPSDFSARYVAEFKVAPNGYSAMGYDAANLFLSAIAHGADSRSRVLDAVRAVDVTGVAGRYRFTGTGERAPETLTLWIFTVRDGKAEVSSLPVT